MDKIAKGRRGAPGFTSVRAPLSVYGKRLMEKQKLKFMSGISERQLRNYLHKAMSMKGEVGENLLTLIERRLDNVVYKLGFAMSRPQARQFVVHGMVLVNGKNVNIPSYLVKIGDEIKIKDKYRDNIYIKKNIEERSTVVPEWLVADYESLSGKVVRYPTKNEVSYPVDTSLIVEFYSR
jgi:small subunit ribosomal protein S4